MIESANLTSKAATDLDNLEFVSDMKSDHAARRYLPQKLSDVPLLAVIDHHYYVCSRSSADTRMIATQILTKVTIHFHGPRDIFDSPPIPRFVAERISTTASWRN